MSSFYRFREGGGRPKGTMSPFFTAFLRAGLPYHLDATYNGIPLPAGTAPANLSQTWGRGLGGFIAGRGGKGGLRPFNLIDLAVFWYKSEGCGWRSLNQQHVKFYTGTKISFGWFHQSLTFSRYLQQILWKSIEHHFIWEKLSNIVWNRDPVWRWKWKWSQNGTKGKRKQGAGAFLTLPCKSWTTREKRQPESFKCIFSKQIEPQVKLYPGQHQGWGSCGQVIRLIAMGSCFKKEKLAKHAQLVEWF